MKTSLPTVLGLLALVLPAQGVAQENTSVLGSWEMTMETPRGAVSQVFTFVEDAGHLTGTVTTPRGETELEDVSFESGELTFRVTRSFRGNQMTQSFWALVDGDAMDGTISGGRGGERPFTAERTGG